MRRIILPVSLSLALFVWVSGAEAKRPMTVRIGKGEAVVSYLEGTARVLAAGRQAPIPLKVNDLLKGGDEITTGSKTKMEMYLPDGSMIRFSDNSSFRILQLDAGEEQRRDVKVHVAIGKAWANVSKSVAGKDSFELTCENAVAGVRGTVYRMNVLEDKSAVVKVYDGTVYVKGGGPALEAPVAVEAPHRVEGPRPVAGPRRVSMEEWTFIIRSMQQIAIGADGTPGRPQDFSEQEDRSEWVDWNRAQDAAATP